MRAHRSSSSRTRWAAIGAAVAITLGAGGIQMARATIGSGAKPVFVAIQSCRLVDTRPGAPIGPDATVTLAVRGTNGGCTIPTGAVAVAANVTAVNPTATSAMTVWRADLTRPSTPNLHYTAADDKLANAVTVGLSDTGKIKVYNQAGTVDVLIDIAGYYEGHTHDDRYYTKAQVDAKIPSTERVNISGAAFATSGSTGADVRLMTGGTCVRNSSDGTPLVAPLALPVGATITRITGYFYDGSTSTRSSVVLRRDTTGGTTAALATVYSATVLPTGLQTSTVALTTPEPVDVGDYFSLYYAGASTTTTHQVCGAAVEYVVPAG